MALDPGWAGIIGAAVGGLGTLGGTWITGRQTRKAASQANTKLISATALLMQDDFYHFQVTLARALNRWDWWTDAEVLQPQASVDDRKTVWAALPYSDLQILRRRLSCADGKARPGVCDSLEYLSPTSSSRFKAQAPNTIINVVADAQGWMDYLIQRRNEEVIHSPPGPPRGADFETMKWAFALLDIGRVSLQELARRPATDFSNFHILQLDNITSVLSLLGRDGEATS